MAIELCLIGILNVWTHIPSVAWTQAILTLVWTFTFQLSAGQLGKSCNGFPQKTEANWCLLLGWALPAEIGSTRLRQKTVCLARNATNILGVICGTLENYFMNPTAWNLKGYTGYVSPNLSGLFLAHSLAALSGVDVPLSSLCGPISASQRPREEPLTNWTLFSPSRFLLANSLPLMLTPSTRRRTISWLISTPECKGISFRPRQS